MIKKSINLVKAAKKPLRVKKQLDKIYLFINFFIAVLLVSITIVAIVLNAVIISNNQKIAEFEQKIEKTEKDIIAQAGYKKTYEFLKKYNADMAYVLEIIKLTPVISEGVFSSIEDSKVNGITLTEFKIDRGVIHITAHGPNEDDIIQYIENLRGSESFSEVDWQGSISKEGDLFKCSLLLSINV